MLGNLSKFHDRGGVEIGNLLDAFQRRYGRTSARVDDDLSFDLQLVVVRHADLEDLGTAEVDRAFD